MQPDGACGGHPQRLAALLRQMAETIPGTQIPAAFGQTEMSPVTCMLLGEEVQVALPRNPAGEVLKTELPARFGAAEPIDAGEDLLGQRIPVAAQSD